MVGGFRAGAVLSQFVGEALHSKKQHSQVVQCRCQVLPLRSSAGLLLLSGLKQSGLGCGHPNMMVGGSKEGQNCAGVE
jgi:hypothetical protein